MNNFIYYNNLFDIYSSFLTDNQKEIFILYYEENLSMQEIADLKKVSKSFVGKSIKDSEDKLNTLENTLHNFQNKESLNKLLVESDIKILKDKLKLIINNI
jgi:predicted DNA-binding protein YlxM (UPF0122 family)